MNDAAVTEQELEQIWSLYTEIMRVNVFFTRHAMRLCRAWCGGDHSQARDLYAKIHRGQIEENATIALAILPFSKCSQFLRQQADPFKDRIKEIIKDNDCALAKHIKDRFAIRRQHEHFVKRERPAPALRPACQCRHCGKEYRPKQKGRVNYCSRECYFAAKTLAALRRAQHCRICGNKLPDGCTHYCSKECEYQAKLERATFVRSPIIYNKTCSKCGNEFQTGYPHQRFCSKVCANRTHKKILTWHEKECQACGGFIPYRVGGSGPQRWRFCSKQCHRRAYKFKFHPLREAAPPLNKKCLFCGNEFVTGSGTMRLRRYCSKQCARDASSVQSKARTEEDKSERRSKWFPVSKECVRCGVGFLDETKPPTKKYCTDRCYALAKQARINLKAKQRRMTNGNQEQPR